MVALVHSSQATIAPQLFAGRYRLLQEVGKSDCSYVYQAIDTFDDNRLVAVKRLRQSGLPVGLRGAARQSYRREAAILPQLSHLRIPRLHEASLDGSLWYLVLDYIPGETLECYLKRQPIPLPLLEVIDLGLQICDVLVYLHEHRPPVKFRDLKPANLMRKPSGQIALIDFGLACPFRPGRLDPVALGTAGYAAPEQYANEYGQSATTLQSDIYSLGVILHRLLSGEVPQPSTFTFSPLVNTVPDLAELVASMLNPEPEQRVQHIRAVQARLQAISAQASFDLSKEYAIT